jgi:hypothetical protein
MLVSIQGAAITEQEMPREVPTQQLGLGMYSRAVTTAKSQGHHMQSFRGYVCRPARHAMDAVFIHTPELG